MSSYVVRDVLKEDLVEIARIHANSFSDRALIMLGDEAVRRYYSFLLEDFPLSKPICATNGAGSLVGYCFAGVYSGSFSGFIKKNISFLILRILSRPWLIFNPLIWELIKPVFHVFRWILRSRKVKKVELNVLPPKTVDQFMKDRWGILAIAVDPRFQRRGIGDLLMESVENHAKTLGIDRLNLSVHPENIQAVRFYEKLGWEKITSPNGWDGKMVKRLA